MARGFPLTFLYANFAEYWGHGGPMHHLKRGLRLVYERHTKQHHRFFTDRAMELDGLRDLRAVLFPPILMTFFITAFALPVGLLLAWIASPNVAWLFNQLNQWRPVNDTVMGGISDSSMQMTEAGVLSFTGMVSLENNGGFASLQSSPSQYDLSGYQGISLRIRGDGKRYKFSLKNNQYLDSARYEAPFATEKDQWMTVTIPFSTLKPTL